MRFAVSPPTILLFLVAGCQRQADVLAPASLVLDQELGDQDLVPELAPDAADRINYAGPGLALVDLDDDGWLDLAVASLVGPVRLFWNDGTGHLIPWVLSGDVPEGQALAAGDLNDDGAMDLVIGRAEGELDLILFGDGDGHFTLEEIPDSLDHTVTISALDADRDRRLDLFAARNAQVVDPDAVFGGTIVGGASALHRNEGGTFSVESAAIPESEVHSLAFIGAPLDADLDRDLDLYIANDFGPHLQPNALLENDGYGLFSLDAGSGANVEMYSMGAAVGDLNDDGWPDLHITNLDSPILLLNSGDGDFYDATVATGAHVAIDETHTTSWGNAILDLNRDGWQDLLVAYGPINFWDDSHTNVFELDGVEVADAVVQADVALLNGPDGFSDVSEEMGFDALDVGRALAVGDLDRDGLADVVTAGWTGPESPYVRVFRGEGGGGGVTVVLDYADVGAEVTVNTDERTTTHWLLPSTSFSTSAPEIYAGLGLAESAEITVTFPDGGAVSWKGVAPGDILRP